MIMGYSTKHGSPAYRRAAAQVARTFAWLRDEEGWRMNAEDVMARQWSDLSDRSRRLIITAAVAEAILKTAVIIDIRRQAGEPGSAARSGCGS